MLYFSFAFCVKIWHMLHLGLQKCLIMSVISEKRSVIHYHTWYYFFIPCKAIPPHVMQVLRGRGSIALTHSCPGHYMGVSGQCHAQPHFTPRNRPPVSVGCVGLRAGLDAEARGKILCFCQGSNCGRTKHILNQSKFRINLGWSHMSLFSSGHVTTARNSDCCYKCSQDCLI
jgi:hypothetical protein